jgi:hypothetical protein
MIDAASVEREPADLRRGADHPSRVASRDHSADLPSFEVVHDHDQKIVVVAIPCLDVA